MNKYKAVGFDWSGVTYFYVSSYAEVVRDLYGIPFEQFYDVYYRYNHLLNTKSVSKLEVWKQIFSHFDKENEASAFLEYLKELPLGCIHEEMIELIRELKNQGYKVGLFSNHTLDGAKEARALGLEDIFDVVIFSAEVGVMKPQGEAYMLLAKKLGVSVTELIFIDDTEKSLLNAEKIGYTPILYSDMEKLRYELSNLLV